MGFLGVYKAIYDYAPQAEGELAINDGDVLYILEKNSEDDWWKAKKKASADDDEEPEGLIPNNYVEEAQPVAKARALYEYTRQTDEELSFPEDAVIDVFDTSDPDWILVGRDGDYGFVPSNYIEIGEPEETVAQPSPPPALPMRSIPATTSTDNHAERPESAYSSTSLQQNSPAAALAGVMAGRSAPRAATPPLPPQSPSEPSDDEPVRSPALPARPVSQAAPAPAHVRSERSIDTHLYADSPEIEEPPYRAPGGFHMYNINEMVSVMGKRKKMPTTLGVNLATGTILIAPERAQDGPSQEWTADKMTHYSREGKHVFLELVKPSKSVDFHAGAKDTAEEIVSALGELAGAVRAEGLREVILAGAGKGQKKGQVLYDFMAQGDDEVTVAVGDDVVIIDDTKSEEWWQVRRIKNGKEGVVPSSYIEVTGSVTPPGGNAGLNAAKSTVEQNRLEEIRLTKEAVKAAQRDSSQQVGPGMPLPKRGSSLMAQENGNNYGQRNKRENGRSEGGGQSRKSKPDASKVRTWTDRSKSFSVEAQFLGLKDGKINLHKMNGVKIAVPVAKMSVEDLEYVERITGISLDEDKPLSNVKKARAASQAGALRDSAPVDRIGASVGQPQKPEYDWFQFFLSCDVAVGLCERYAQAFSKDSMDESVLPDVDASVLRNLGLREGDIIKVMRTLDQKYGRVRSQGSDKGTVETDGSSGGLFSGPGGALRNNTRKGRPAPAVQTSDVVDPKAFSRKDDGTVEETVSKSPSSASAIPASGQKGASGFDDDAWDVKPMKQPQEPPRPAAAVAAVPIQATASQPPAEPVSQATPIPQAPALTGSMQELSLLTTPLEPQRTAQPPASTPAVSHPPAQAPQPTGATPSFFATVRPSPSVAQSPQQSMQRQRPAPPPTSSGPGSLMPPPPARPLSAPQSAQPSAFAPPPLAPQMTGFQTQVAPPGQSLNEMNQARLQQQYVMQQQQQQMPQSQMNPYPVPQSQPIPGVMGFNPGMQPTGGQFMQSMQPMMTGAPAQSPFADPQRQSQFSPMQPQATGFSGQFGAAQGFNPQHTGNINSFLPPAMEPQRTGMPAFQPQPTGFGGFNNVGGASSMPSLTQPLQPQKTGPPPPVRFGVTGDAKKLMPQPTGRRANLSQATPNNPFGF
ncbi:cytoskeleton assembly control protein sla1 [Colletotrichum truncatum]|uniref:Cytoskeleton assembly control protein sla1 n=1 Tax=Colletotrichum truncatum TaxID=5467 RepID=A0ACC3YXJ1_COLTU|nr:cytoskeleton assembly control protein sla1 [Colletotrichum truncatum]KAF6792391.1 cytoskeleton assembly control protein sla1 [Colletotrichum truncatum]